MLQYLVKRVPIYVNPHLYTKRLAKIIRQHRASSLTNMEKVESCSNDVMIAADDPEILRQWVEYNESKERKSGVGLKMLIAKIKDENKFLFTYKLVANRKCRDDEWIGMIKGTKRLQEEREELYRSYQNIYFKNNKNNNSGNNSNNNDNNDNSDSDNCGINMTPHESFTFNSNELNPAFEFNTEIYNKKPVKRYSFSVNYKQNGMSLDMDCENEDIELQKRNKKDATPVTMISMARMAIDTQSTLQRKRKMEGRLRKKEIIIDSSDQFWGYLRWYRLYDEDPNVTIVEVVVKDGLELGVKPIDGKTVEICEELLCDDTLIWYCHTILGDTNEPCDSEIEFKAPPGWKSRNIRRYVKSRLCQLEYN